MEYFGTNFSEKGHCRWNITNEKFENIINRFIDLPFHPEEMTNHLKNGNVIYYNGDGYTVLGISGSCLDTRPESKTIFWLKENLTKDEMIAKIMLNKLADKIIKSLPFEIKW